jgi:tetratricopeptide (TPR) repeat protein
MKNGIVVGTLLALATAGLGFGQQAQGQAKKTPAVKSQKEAQDLQAVLQAPDVDSRIKAADDFVSKYSDSDFRGLALFAEAQSYQMKGDTDKMVIYGERGLEANPDETTKVQTLLMLAQGIAQKTREFDLDREEKLGKAEKYAHEAMDALNTMAKPNPNLPDEKWVEAKADMIAQGHEALGLAGMARKKYDVGIAEFKTAIETSKTPEPATELRLANAYNLSKKPDDAIPVLDKLLAEPNVPAPIRQLAQAERVKALQAKGGAAAAPATPPPAGTPPTPPTPPPAKP